MSYQHADIYIITIVEPDGDSDWFVGPYGSTRADQVADDLEAARHGRVCKVVALFSDDDCLRVDDYRRRDLGSLI